MPSKFEMVPAIMNTEKSANVIALTLDIPELLREAVPIALVRASYLYPDLCFENRDAKLLVQGSADATIDALRKDLMYLFYREHIRMKFEPFRQRALERLYGSAR